MMYQNLSNNQNHACEADDNKGNPERDQHNKDNSENKDKKQHGSDCGCGHQ